MATGRKTGGRKRGTPNKLTASIKAAIEQAFVAEGGADYLRRVARDHPAVFCGLLGRVLPTQIEGSDGEKLNFTFVLDNARAANDAD